VAIFVLAWEEVVERVIKADLNVVLLRSNNSLLSNEREKS